MLRSLDTLALLTDDVIVVCRMSAERSATRANNDTNIIEFSWGKDMGPMQSANVSEDTLQSSAGVADRAFAGEEEAGAFGVVARLFRVQ